MSELETERLRLRRWREGDREPFAALNTNPVVMEHFPALTSRSESDAMVDRIEAHFDRRGFGLWAVEVRGGAPFVGFVGLWTPMFEAHFTPAVEVGWRLARAHWGHGYATEAARAAVDYGFEELELEEIVAFTVPGNFYQIGVSRWRIDILTSTSADLPFEPAWERREYMTVSGIQVPFHTVLRRGPLQPIERDVTTIRFNVPLDAALFVKPS